MSALLDLYLNEKMLETLLSVVRQKGEKGVSLTVSVSDDSNQYGQNVSAYVSQTKDQREAKMNKFYTGNGKVFWTDGKIQVAAKKEAVTSLEPSSGGLPF